MARILIVGCGCRGRALGSALRESGHAVRGTSRTPAGLEKIAATGLEPWAGDPDRIGTLTGALDAVTVLCWLLGDASGDSQSVAALHTTRWARMLEETVNTTVRGVVYEAAGAVDAALLQQGAALVADAHERWSIPVAVIASEPAEHAAWLAAALDAVMRLLGAKAPM